MISATKLDELFTHSLNGDLRNSLITRGKNGQYFLFGKYTIVSTKEEYYKITYNTNTTCNFASMKHALSWCIFVNAGKHREAKKIQLLDMQLCSIDVDIAVHRRMFRLSKEPSAKDIYLIKVQEDTIKRKKIVAELNSYINSSKQIQIRNFTDKNKNKMNFKYF